MCVFEKKAEEYDAWFEQHRMLYLSEVEAVRALIPKDGTGVEIGVGTGRFSLPFGISKGVEPAAAMRKWARKKGLNPLAGRAEALPFSDQSFHFALLITTLCFVQDPLKALQEIYRILLPKGQILLGLIDADSSLGKTYLARKTESVFYREARFFCVKETTKLLEKAGFSNFHYRQTLFHLPLKLQAPDVVREGFGEGGFVVISGVRT